MTTEKPTATEEGQAPPAQEAGEIKPPPIQTNGGDGAAEARKRIAWSPRGGMQIRTMEDASQFANWIAMSGWAPLVGPKSARRPMNRLEIFAAVQYGAEIGLSPMQAIQSIAVINGRPTVWGDALLAVCRMSGVFDDNGFEESHEGTPFQDDYTRVCRCRRVGSKTVYAGKFSVADAKRAGLWGKDLYEKYPDRMLQMRARAFALRDAYADVLKGLHAREELTADDVLAQIDMGDSSAPAPVAAPPVATDPLDTMADRVLDDAPDAAEAAGASAAPEPSTADVESLIVDIVGLGRDLLDAGVDTSEIARRNQVLGFVNAKNLSKVLPEKLRAIFVELRKLKESQRADATADA